MKNIEVKKLIKTWEKMEDYYVLEYILGNRETLTSEGMRVWIGNGEVLLTFTKNMLNEDECYCYTFNTFGYELLNELFKANGFVSDLV